MYLDQLFSEALSLAPSAIAYHVSRTLAEAFADRAILEGRDCDFDLEEFARAGGCTLRPEADLHNQFDTMWDREKGIWTCAANAWYEVEWRGHLLDVVLMGASVGCWGRHWILAATREVASEFYAEVCRWTPEVRGEVLVFDGGYWQRSESLYASVKAASFDDLVLDESLKRDLRADLDRFFASKELYESHGIPWKRGLLLMGPPGNGKTHAVKALANASGKPCLYVKSFDSEERLDKSNMRQVLDRARRLAPCLLVIEDLDSHIDDKNRSFFLNELDGFTANLGVAIVATTNHPEKLDSAILDRPSRFDRKYHFGPPAAAERLAYLTRWDGTWREPLRLSAAGRERVAGMTEGFSFAYLKELCVSSMMRWVDAAVPGSMDGIMAEQAESLRGQLAKPDETPGAATTTTAS